MTLNPESIDFPKEFLECRQAWFGIRTEVQALRADFAAYVDGKMASASWAWSPVVKAVDPNKLDRLGDSLRSPVFCSEAHPWPEDQGKPMLPMLQLNLGRASEIGRIALGNGLLQMFIAAGDPHGQRPHFRVIPLEDARAESLMPVPHFESVQRPLVSIDWACMEFDDDDLETKGLQIVSFKKPRFVLQSMDRLSELLDLNSLDDKDLVRRMNAFDAVMKKRAAKWRPYGFHLFGTFESIQYVAADKSRPLFCLESDDYGFNFGDGNGQVFFDLTEPQGIGFSFDWSCC